MFLEPIPRTLTTFPYIIIDDNQESIRETKAMAARFPLLKFAGFASNYEDGLNLILEFRPEVVFLEIDPEDADSKLSLGLINELYRYLKVLPKFIITTKDKELSFEAIRHGVFDYLIKPLEISEFRKCILRFERSISDSAEAPLPELRIGEPRMVIADDAQNDEILEPATSEIMLPIVEMAPVEVDRDKSLVVQHEEKPLVICVKSYGDYRFINASDICYLQADNNSTDIHLNNGEMITAFKTLKHFETVLSSPFVRIHNSYIVNIDYVSRIHTGNAVCYIKNTTTKLPFSKSYKENVDAILTSITKGNYLEI